MGRNRATELPSEAPTEARRRNMAAVRGKNTKPELLVRSSLHKRGFRFSLHRKDLPGNPDIVLPKWHAAVLVHGCFWHGHRCDLFVIPKTRREFWLKKISGNVTRDLRAEQELQRTGWRVAVIWECALKGKHKLPDDQPFQILDEWLRSSSQIIHVEGNHVSRLEGSDGGHEAGRSKAVLRQAIGTER